VRLSVKLFGEAVRKAMCKADEAEQGKEAVGDAVRKAVWQDCS